MRYTIGRVLLGWSFACILQLVFIVQVKGIDHTEREKSLKIGSVHHELKSLESAKNRVFGRRIFMVQVHHLLSSRIMGFCRI